MNCPSLYTESHGHRVILFSASPLLLRWAFDYLSPWWDTAYAKPPLHDYVVSMSVETHRYLEVLTRVLRERQLTGRFLAAPATRARVNGSWYVYIPSRDSVFVHNEVANHIEVVGMNSEIVASQASLIACLLLQGILEREGWVTLHSACVVGRHRCLLILGAKGSGKTSTCLALAQLPGVSLLGNDRCLVRIRADNVEVLNYPQSIRIGLPLINALGWTKSAREAVRGTTIRSGRQDEAAIQWLMQDGPESDAGLDLADVKLDLAATHLRDIFGYRLATRGVVTDVVYPSLSLESRPTLARLQGRIGRVATHMISDPIPNFLVMPCPNPRTIAASRRITARALAKMPSYRVRVGSLPDANRDLLRQILEH